MNIEESAASRAASDETEAPAREAASVAAQRAARPVDPETGNTVLSQDEIDAADSTGAFAVTDDDASDVSEAEAETTAEEGARPEPYI